MRQKLAERRRVKEVDAGVENARGQITKCLKENDGRPLNCWQEVEKFKKEVGRMEKNWVEKVIG